METLSQRARVATENFVLKNFRVPYREVWDAVTVGLDAKVTVGLTGVMANARVLPLVLCVRKHAKSD